MAGEVGAPLKAEITGVKKLVRRNQVLNDAGIVAESECGHDTIVRANSSILLQGAARARVKSDMLALTLRVVSCK